MEKDDSGAATVCGHVATTGLPILYAERSAPIDEVDSGWQFLCASGIEEDIDEAQTWSINEVITEEPTLRDYMSYPVGTKLIRSSSRDPWKIAR